MDALRQKIIYETLNYERSMNRIILDRTIEQAKLFNEERSPPSNRDIKFEAQITKLIDKLKQTIQEGINAVNYETHPNVDLATFDRNMRSNAGEEGKVISNRPPPTVEQVETQGVEDDDGEDGDGDDGGENEEDDAVAAVENLAAPGTSLPPPPAQSTE